MTLDDENLSKVKSDNSEYNTSIMGLILGCSIEEWRYVTTYEAALDRVGYGSELIGEVIYLCAVSTNRGESVLLWKIFTSLIESGKDLVDDEQWSEGEMRECSSVVSGFEGTVLLFGRYGWEDTLEGGSDAGWWGLEVGGAGTIGGWGGGGVFLDVGGEGVRRYDSGGVLGSVREWDML
ncbi:hypothetical protein Tco_0084675 [Tanacetum coccineum]